VKGRDVNNINWGHLKNQAGVMPPGTVAGDGRCEAGQWGVLVEDIVVYGSLTELRTWAQTILDDLPAARHEAPLVLVDPIRQEQWLTWSGVLDRITEDGPADAVSFVLDLVRAVAVNPGQAGWTLGDNVAALWADLDDLEGVMAGVRLVNPAYEVGMGEPLLEDDLAIRLRVSPVERADAYLRVVAERINNAY
jgi:hypothetical protein